MSVPVVVPVNHLSLAKGRLADILTPEQRSELALTTLRTVLQAVGDAGSTAIVLSPDDAVRSSVVAPHTALDESSDASGLNQQLACAIDQLGGREMLILHGDLPLVTGTSLRTFIARAPEGVSVTIVESQDGGTNAMLLRPPSVIPLQYGRGSAALHRAAAETARATIVTVDAPDIALDLDTPADIATLLDTENGRTSAAGRLLRSWGFGLSESSD